MSSSHREFFTVDLRGLRSRLKGHAASNGLTESAVLRNVLAAALGTEQDDSSEASAVARDRSITTQVKLSVRLPRSTASRLDDRARAVGLPRGVYLMRLIDGAPPVVASSERAAMVNALNASSEELAVMSRDIHQLIQLLRQGSVEAARAYTRRHEALDADVRRHLALAAPVLAKLGSMCLTVKQAPVRSRSGHPP